jgi:hypothetical protein
MRLIPLQLGIRFGFSFIRVPNCLGLTDAAAEAKMNVSLAGPRSIAVGQPQSTVLSGLGFTISQFEQKEPPLIKHAKIFTTICKSQLVSFALVSNSEEQLSALEESLKTLDFSGH